MNTLLSLWWPILLSAVIVFVISSLVHMVFKWHASDYHTLPNEDVVRDAIRSGRPTPGRYVLPHCREMKNMGSETMQKKYREGPVAHVTIVPNGVPNMGRYLGLWFLWSLAIATVAAYLAGQLLGLDHRHARAAAKLVGAITFIGHGFGTVSESIWMGRPCAESAGHLRDAVLYGVGSAFVFLWLWP